MNVVGECVGRIPTGLVAAARGDRHADHVDLRRHGLQLVVRLREQRLVRGRGGSSLPSVPNCGIQNRFRFGSLPITKSLIVGLSRAIAAA